MIVFAHLRKCAGTSVVQAAVGAGMVLPAGHVNGHPPGPDGHALAGLSRMSPEDLGRFTARMAGGGVEFMALEWDVPPLARFPAAPRLDFFTIFRDPVERFLSNYAYDVTRRWTASRTPWDYLGGPGLWQASNYYTRFFCGLSASDPVGDGAVDEAAAIIGSRVRWASFGEDLLGFLRDEVGLPIRALPRANRTSRVLKLLSRSSLDVAERDVAELRRRNEADYALLAALAAQRRASGRGHRIEGAIRTLSEIDNFTGGRSGCSPTMNSTRASTPS